MEFIKLLLVYDKYEKSPSKKDIIFKDKKKFSK